MSMNNMPGSCLPWGKLDRSAPGRATASRLSLVARAIAIDVAAVTQALLSLPTWRAGLEPLQGRAFTAIDIDRMTVLAL